MSQKPIQLDQIEDITVSDISATGTASSSTYLRGDGAWATPEGGSGDGIASLVEDTSPQLGGDLDLNSKKVGDATAADLTKLHGVTASATELNTLDGITASVTELNYVDGVTSNVQTQLDAKVDESTTVNGHALSSNVTVSKSDVGLGNVTNDAQLKAADLVDEDDMASNSATKVPSQQSVKAYVDANAGGASSLDDLSDVGTSGASDGDVLTYDSDTSSWGPAASSGGGMTNPMTSQGDVIYGGSSGTPTRLAKGTDGQVLTLASGVPSWADAAGGGGGSVDWSKVLVSTYAPDTSSVYITTSGANTTLTQNAGLQVDFSSSDSTHQFNLGNLFISNSDSAFWDSLLYGYAYLRYFPNRNVTLGIGVGGTNTNSTNTSAYTGKGLGLRNSGNTTIVVRNGDGSSETTTDVASSFPANDTTPGLFKMHHNPGVNDKFYKDDTLLATHTTNLASGSSSNIQSIAVKMYYGSSGQSDRLIIGQVGLIQVKS